MTEPHPLAPLLSPRSVAIFGASNDPGRISGRPLRYYKEAGYQGALYPINPNRAVVQGVPAYPDLESVPGPVEFALIAVPAAHALSALEAAAKKGVRAAVMFTAGFAETGAAGRELQERAAAIARAGGLRLCGPNCLGLFNLRLGHTPTFGSYLEAGPERPGPLGMITQSGAFGTHLLALARRRGIGVGIWVSTGNEADIQVADGISFLADDPETAAIACYMEAIKDRDRFAAAVTRARASGKPVIAIKVGGSAIGAAAAASHTASLAGSDAIYDAAFRQWGVERARTPEDLVEIAYACTRGRLPRTRRLAVVTISGGAGVLMADAAERFGVDLAPLSPAAQAEVTSWVPFAAARNPVDLTAQPINEPALLEQAFDLLLGREGFPAIIAYLLALAESPKLGETVHALLAAAARRYPDRYIALSVIAREEIRRRYEEAGIALFEDPWRAVEAVAAAMRCAERLAEPAAVPPPVPQGVPPLPQRAIGEYEAKRVLAMAGVPVLDERLARSPEEAEAAAAALGERLALKIVSPDVTHKTEIGGVLLDVPRAEAGAAYRKLVAAVAEQAPKARCDGVLIAPMIADGIETIIGVQGDPVFGPVVMFGLGGVFVEVLRDVTFRLAPFGIEEARRMIGEIRGRALLEGARGRPKSDVDALALALSRLSVFAAAQAGRFSSIEINPLLVRPQGHGVAALDALILTSGGVDPHPPPSAPEEPPPFETPPAAAPQDRRGVSKGAGVGTLSRIAGEGGPTRRIGG
ncbi:MAG TPA: acetate--CoA ligase family protein [Stellaceae bacterium]|nr:acetate--CoA ligase family protein [Stellaceae bacterium]